MNPLVGPLSAQQSQLIRLLLETYRGHHAWPPWQFVEQSMDLTGSDARQVIDSLPRVGSKHGFYGLSYGLTWRQGMASIDYQQDDRIGLTVAGMHRTGADEYVNLFLSVLALACRKLQDFVPDPRTVISIELTSSDLAEEPSKPHFATYGLTPQQVYELLEHEPAMWLGGRGIMASGDWQWEITRAIRRYCNVRTVEDYVQAVTEAAEESAQQVARILPSAYTTQSDSVTRDGIDQAAVSAAELPFLSPEIPLLGTAVDSELWEYVRPLAEKGRWEQVAREAAAFVETRARNWTESKREILDLMSELLAPPRVRGEAQKQNTAERNEHEGWHLLARGFFLAVRNHVMHNSVGVEEQLQYGLGALGTASLIVRRIRAVLKARSDVQRPDRMD